MVRRQWDRLAMMAESVIQRLHSTLVTHLVRISCLHTNNSPCRLQAAWRGVHSPISIVRAATSTQPLPNTADMTFGDAIRARRATKAFASTPIPDATLAEILRLTQRAPSGFNTQPYVCVIVRDQAQREKLAEAVMQGNVPKIQQAPVIAVFAADIEPNLRVPRIQELQLKAGVPPAVVDNLPSAVRLFSQHELPADTPAPLDAPAIAWSFKQTSLAVATLLYAAQDHGVATGPMEGFYEAKVREVLGIPDRYKVSIIVALGYPKEGTRVHDTVRLPPTEVFFEGEFGQSSEKLFQA